MIKTLRLIITLGIGIYTIFYIIESLFIITYPFQISYPEGFVFAQSSLLSKGISIYGDISDYPYIVVNYPPLYLYLCAVLIKIFGVSLAPGRAITFLSSIFILFLIYKILKDETTKRIAVISALLFISSSYIYKCNPFFRVDMLGLLFSILGIFIYYTYDQKKDTFFCIPFFLASLYTKPTFFSAPFSVFLYLLFNQRKKVIPFVVLMAIPYFGIFLLLNHLTNGAFFKNNILYNMNIFIFTQATKHYTWFLQNHALMILFSLIFLFLPNNQRKHSIFAKYFITSAVVALSVGKIGANMNYFFETIAVSSILTGLALNRLKDFIKDARIYEILTNSALLVQLALFLHMPFLTEPTATKSDLKNAKALSDVVRNTDGKIISEDAAVLVLNNKPVLFMPFEFTQLANQKMWNQTKFVDDIKSGAFSLIILSFDVNCFFDEERLTLEMVQAIKEHYILKERIGNYYLFYPTRQVE